MATITPYPHVEHGQLFRHSQWEPVGGSGIYRRSLYIWQNFRGRSKRCDILLFLDGQNLFAAPQKPGRLHWDGERKFSACSTPLVVVGVPASQKRYPEYIGWSREPGHYSPSGHKHARFLAEYLLPYLKTRYPRSRLKGLVGASAGGVAALYAGWCYPGLFPSLCCLSAGRHYFQELLEAFPGCPSPRLYLSCGDRGMDKGFLEQNKWFASQLKQRRVQTLQCRWHRGTHSEPVWSRRLPDILRFTLAET